VLFKDWCKIGGNLAEYERWIERGSKL